MFSPLFKIMVSYILGSIISHPQIFVNPKIPSKIGTTKYFLKQKNKPLRA